MPDLEYVDKVTHALKSVKATIAMEEADQEQSYGRYYARMPEYGNNGSYGRGRDSRGRYMSEGPSSNLANELKRVLAQESDPHKREAYEDMLDKLNRL
jgi:hypothetical protein